MSPIYQRFTPMLLRGSVLPWLLAVVSACAPTAPPPPVLVEPLPAFDEELDYAWEDSVLAAEEDSLQALLVDESLLAKILRSHPALQELEDLYQSGGHHYFQRNLDLAEEHFWLLKEGVERETGAQPDSLALLYLGSLERKLEHFIEILTEERFFSESYAPRNLSLNDAYDSLRVHYGIPEFLLPQVEPSSYEREVLLVDNAKVQTWIDYFRRRAKGSFQTWLDRKAEVGHILEGILEEEGLPRELVYLSMIESGLKSSIRSRAAAVGYWQFVRSTARNRGLLVNEWVDERRDIEKATRAACRHLKMMYGMFGNWPLALAAYNAGEYRIQRAIGLQGDPDYWELRLPRETREYVPKLIAASRIGADPEAYGFRVGQGDSLRYDIVHLDDAYSLDQVEKATGIAARTLRALNPQLLVGVTPPKVEDYALRVPAGAGERMAEAIAAIPEDERITWRRHRVRSGETLGQLARHYRTSVNAIMELNGISNPRRVRTGRVLTIPFPRGGSAVAASPTPSSSTSPPAGMSATTHVVQRGDTLDAIARSHGVTVSHLKRVNGLRNDRIHPGQRLVLHQPASTDGEAPASYIVRRGDTLSGIGRRFGVRVADLLRWNQLPTGGRIWPGDVLKLRAPGGD